MRTILTQTRTSASATFLISAQSGLSLDLDLFPELLRELSERNMVNIEIMTLATTTAHGAILIVKDLFSGPDTLMLNGHSQNLEVPVFDKVRFKTLINYMNYLKIVESVNSDTSVIANLNMDLSIHDVRTEVDSKFLTEFQIAAGVAFGEMLLYSYERQLNLLSICIDVLLTCDVYDALLAKQIQKDLVHLLLTADSVCQHNLRICEVYAKVVYELQSTKTIFSQWGTVLFAAPSVEWMDAVVHSRAIKMLGLIAPTDFQGYDYIPLISHRAVENRGTYAAPAYLVTSL